MLLPGFFCALFRAMLVDPLDPASAIALPNTTSTEPVRLEPAKPAPKPATSLNLSHDDLVTLGQRWATGVKIKLLAAEVGCTWNKLYSELTKLGYKAGQAVAS